MIGWRDTYYYLVGMLAGFLVAQLAGWPTLAAGAILVVAIELLCNAVKARRAKPE